MLHLLQFADGRMPDPIPNPDPNPKQARLLQLLRAYGDVVPTSLFGHHHTESLRVVRDEQGVARHVMYLSPALTPRNPRHDPAVRLYPSTMLTPLTRLTRLTSLTRLTRLTLLLTPCRCGSTSTCVPRVRSPTSPTSPSTCAAPTGSKRSSGGTPHRSTWLP